MAAFDTTDGKAYGLELEEGTINVGDTIGIYRPDEPMPAVEAEVVAIQYNGERREVIGRNTSSARVHRSTLFLKLAVVLAPPFLVGPNVRDLAKAYGLTDDNLL